MLKPKYPFSVRQDKVKWIQILLLGTKYFCLGVGTQVFDPVVLLPICVMLHFWRLLLSTEAPVQVPGLQSGFSHACSRSSSTVASGVPSDAPCSFLSGIYQHFHSLFFFFYPTRSFLFLVNLTCEFHLRYNLFCWLCSSLYMSINFYESLPAYMCF